MAEEACFVTVHFRDECFEWLVYSRGIISALAELAILRTLNASGELKPRVLDVHAKDATPTYFYDAFPKYCVRNRQGEEVDRSESVYDLADDERKFEVWVELV